MGTAIDFLVLVVSPEASSKLTKRLISVDTSLLEGFMKIAASSAYIETRKVGALPCSFAK